MLTRTSEPRPDDRGRAMGCPCAQVTGVFGRGHVSGSPVAGPKLASPSQCSAYAGRTQPWRERSVVPISREDRDFVQTLERGLAVLHAFDADHETLTLRETADAAGISRPAARRLLLTLEALGYLSNEGSSYRLTTQVLAFADG